MLSIDNLLYQEQDKVSFSDFDILSKINSGQMLLYLFFILMYPGETQNINVCMFCDLWKTIIENN